ncbi:MAG TPA: RDD family protein [Thermomonospora sp.]|nr:RDD family protein [Thermomonospora sp.]
MHSPPPFPPAGHPPGGDEPAPVLRRLAAWAIDGAVVFGVAALICAVSYARIAEHLRGAGTEALAFGVWDVVSSRGDVAGSAAEAGRNVWDGTVSIVVQGFALLVLAQFLYQSAALSWRGGTLGKALTGIRVQGTGGTRPGPGRAVRRALVTTASETGLYSVACILLLLGQFFLAFACWLLAVTAFAANAAPMVTGRARRTLGDRVGGTVVVRTHLLRATAQALADRARHLRGTTPVSSLPAAADAPALPAASPYHPPFAHPAVPDAQPYPPGLAPPAAPGTPAWPGADRPRGVEPGMWAPGSGPPVT